MEWASRIGCKVGKLPFRYLKLPLRAKKNSKKMWRPIVKFESRLVGWKMRLLSIGGQVTFIKSVLASLLIFYLSIFRMLVKISQELEKIQ